MKKIRIGVICAIIFGVIGSCAFAHMLTQSDSVNVHFDAANVCCELLEVTDNGSLESMQKNSIKVKNTGSVDVYVRVKMVSGWMLNGDVVAKPSIDPAFVLAPGWIEGNDDTYYYMKPLKPGEVSDELLGSAISLTNEDEYYQTLDLFADAIQALPEKAAEESWNVNINNGDIVSVK